MSEERRSRRPLGERDEEERRLPFGARPRPPRPPLTTNAEVREGPDPTAPYPPPPAPEPLADEFTPQDEPSDAPAAIRARDSRHRVAAGDSILKRPRPELSFESFKEDAAPSDGNAEAGAATAVRPVVMIRFGVLARSLGVMFLTAAVVATLFTWWTPSTFMSTDSLDQLSVALATQARQAAAPPAATTPTAPDEAEVAVPATELPPELNNIGIVSGHRGVHPVSGLPDPGATCPDGLTEAEINEAVAQRVVELLRGHGYQVDLLDEFDPRLDNYRALAMVSIHADTCDYINDYATGFKVASFADSQNPEGDRQLVSCLVEQYAGTTGLSFHPSVTYDMTQYHTFREIAPGTPGAIIEIGFMYLDREMLTDHPDVVALGIARGILCYLRGEAPGAENAPTATPLP
ncbi:MAG TPA: N-acetylmuramoyl-L-alanine amidase [Chloroflexi bacterium]|nr:N-acetylmuramoyl-L-alanine amidase [Chloroflexota bacterium]